MNKDEFFDESCTACRRLAGHLATVRREFPAYHAAPVAPFGAARPGLLIVGLAPGLHGANATGRPFTGDHAGIILYETLFKYGFSTGPKSSHPRDGLKLRNCRITNAVKCLPPQNKPTTAEVIQCNGFLRNEITILPQATVIMSLGAIAHGAVLRALALRPKAYPFGHGRCYPLARGGWLIASYHCSRYNTQTRRLTATMFEAVFAQAASLIASAPPRRREQQLK